MDGPDFICIGAQKAGTGWLYDQLRAHPDFWMPPLKELHYFDRAGRSARELRSESTDRIAEARRQARNEDDLRFLDLFTQLRGKEDVDLVTYAALFATKGERLAGDITPGYSALEETMVRRVVESFAGTKIIFFARDPVERAWSQLSMWVRHGVIERGKIDIDGFLNDPAVRARSFPSKIVARWRQFVRPELFRVYFFDDLVRDAAGLRHEIISFLGRDAEKPSGDLSPDYNPKARKEKLELKPEMRARLADFFKDELHVCAAELGGPAVDWPRRYGL
ncbi:MAG: hypothetical protein QOG48_1344 [Verrucomicrobiota bacterium]|jgi:hypothetical protein